MPNNEKQKLDLTQTQEVMPALQRSIELLSNQWIVLVPALVGMIFSQILKFVAQTWFTRFEWLIINWLRYGYFSPQDAPIGFILMIIRGGVAYFLMFVSLDMARNAYLKKEVDIMKSVDYVLNRLIPFILASIFAFIFTYTIILIPIAILMFVIMIVDEKDIKNSITKAYTTLLNNPIPFLILSVFIVIERYILRYILYPYTGHILTAPLDLLFLLAMMHIYIRNKKN